MAFGKARRWRLSKRETTLANNAAHRFYASAAPDPQKAQHFLNELPNPPPKRVIRRPLDGKPVGASEHQEQATVIAWWWRVHKGYGLPHFSLFAVPNGGARDIITGARLKAEGVRKGALDLILAKPNAVHHGLFIEMKVGDNKPSAEQEEFITYLTSVGYKVAVHWNAGTAIKEIEEYLS